MYFMIHEAQYKPEEISLGEFVRTIIRANPFRGGTSEFGYPRTGGYDHISKTLASFMIEKGSEIILGSSVKKSSSKISK